MGGVLISHMLIILGHLLLFVYSKVLIFKLYILAGEGCIVNVKSFGQNRNIFNKTAWYVHRHLGSVA